MLQNMTRAPSQVREELHQVSCDRTRQDLVDLKTIGDILGCAESAKVRWQEVVCQVARVVVQEMFLIWKVGTILIEIVTE